MADLDALLADLADNEAPKPTAARARAADYEDDLDSSDETPKAVRRKYAERSASASDDEDDNDPPLNVDDLDDLIADIESQGKRLYAPKTTGLRAYGARKTTNRKQVKGALDGDDLDRILDEVNASAKRKVAGQTDKLGFGVINAERKFDLRAPKDATVRTAVESTLFVFTQSGEKSRIPQRQISVAVSAHGRPVAHDFIDNKDGTYTIRFRPESEGVHVMTIDAYEKRQFEWEVVVYGAAVPGECTAVANEPLHVNEPCTCTIVARDAAGKQLKVGGAKFNLGFNGAGQLSQVGLLDRMDGTYTLSFVPDTAGQYAIFISLDGHDIKTHPLVFTVK